MAKSLLFPALTYLQLVNLIKTEIADGQKIIQQTQTEKYWEIGQAISEYVLTSGR